VGQAKLMPPPSVWDALERSVARMGRTGRRSIDFNLAPVIAPALDDVLARGVEIDLSELDDSKSHGGLLGYKGAQVLLYIRDHTSKDLDVVLRNPGKGNRFHVAYCSTLRKMKREERFGRYVATNDVSGEFDLTEISSGETREARGALHVCRNCLNFLNYDGYRNDKAAVFSRFELSFFFSTYSTLLEHMPLRDLAVESTVGEFYKQGEETNDRRTYLTHECARCDGDFSGERALVSAVWPTSGEGFDEGSLVELCLDCRRKPPRSERVAVSRSQMESIVARRRVARNVLENPSWKEARALSDSAYLGLLDIYERQGYLPPEPGYDLTDSSDSVVVTLGLAWPATKMGVVLTESEMELAAAVGWDDVMFLEEALLDAQQDG